MIAHVGLITHTTPAFKTRVTSEEKSIEGKRDVRGEYHECRYRQAPLTFSKLPLSSLNFFFFFKISNLSSSPSLLQQSTTLSSPSLLSAQVFFPLSHRARRRPFLRIVDFNTAPTQPMQTPIVVPRSRDTYPDACPDFFDRTIVIFFQYLFLSCNFSCFWYQI